MSLTVFLAMCVLGVDFLIYFFFKLLYGEKRRISPRRLPPDYYKREETSSLYLVPARKERLPGSGRVVSKPKSTELRREPPRELRREERRTPRTNFAENLAYRRITAAFAQSKSRT